MRNIIKLWKRWIAKVKSDSLMEEIRALAYQKAKERNFEPGHDWKDWFEKLLVGITINVVIILQLFNITV